MKTKYHKNYRIDEKSNDIIKGIMDRENFISEAEMFRALLKFFWEKKYPPYVEQQKLRPRITDPMEKAKNKILAEEMIKTERENAKINNGRKLCEILGGTEVSINGYPHCEYPTYCEIGGGQVDIGTNTEPMEYLNDNTVYNQYQTILSERGPDARNKLLKLMGK